MAEPESTSPLRSVNGYEILDLIATGGMSRVYRARNAAGEIVAMKVIQFDEMAADYERRLRREPEVQTGIGHKNIVRLIDWFRVGGEFFLAMEYIDGRSLWSIVHEDVGALPFERARGYLRQILPALAHLHELGIIHRDIKPANILIAKDDTAKLADFGIAKFTWQQGQTRTQVGLGTPEYMSPEQARGVGMDHRTDIYSLGITFYEMLTGQPPFVRDQSTPAAYSEIIQGILSQSVPDPRTVRADVPSGAAAFISRATAKDPKDRFASALQMQRAIEAIESDVKSPSTVAVGAGVAAAAHAHETDVGAEQPARPADAADDMGATDIRSDGSVRVARLRDTRPLLRRPSVLVALVVLLLAGVAFAATQLYDDAPEDVAAAEQTRETPTDVARRTASSYRQYSLDHNIDPLAELYARDSVRYFSDGILSRDSIVQELREDYAHVARTDSFEVVIDSSRALGDTAIELLWRTSYGRMRADSSRYTGATRDELRLERLGERWYIAEHSRRLMTGVSPEGPDPTRRVATSPSRSKSSGSRSSSARASRNAAEEPLVRVQLGRGLRVELGKSGKGSKAKKRRR